MFTTDHIQTSSKQPIVAFHNAKQWDVPPTTYKHRPCNQGLASYLPDAKKGWQKKEWRKEERTQDRNKEWKEWEKERKKAWKKKQKEDRKKARKQQQT